MTTPDPNKPDAADDRGPPPGLAARSVAAACPSLMDLAAYLDGRASEDESHVIELHLARCPQCLEAARDVRHTQGEQGEPLVFVPPRVIESAMALVSAAAIEPALAPPASRRFLHPRIAMRGWTVVARRAVAAAAAIAIGLGGYHVGTGITPAAAASSSEDSLAREISFGLIDPSGTDADGADILALNLEEASS